MFILSKRHILVVLWSSLTAQRVKSSWTMQHMFVIQPCLMNEQLEGLGKAPNCLRKPPSEFLPKIWSQRCAWKTLNHSPRVSMLSQCFTGIYWPPHLHPGSSQMENRRLGPLQGFCCSHQWGHAPRSERSEEDARRLPGFTFWGRCRSMPGWGVCKQTSMAKKDAQTGKRWALWCNGMGEVDVRTV